MADIDALADLLDPRRLERLRVDLGAEALTDGTESVSWNDYVARSRRLAAALAAVGVRRGDRVAVHLKKSVDSFVAVHGVVGAGAVMVPIDPFAPTDVAASVMVDAGARTLITDGRDSVVGELVERAAVRAVVLPRSDGRPDGAEVVTSAAIEAFEPAPPVRVRAADPAYVIYTSGSTGRPKGITHSHRSALTYARAAVDTYGLTSADRLVNIAPLHFDQSTFELWAAPLAGAAAIVVPDPVLRFPASVAELVDRLGGTVWYSVPYLLDQLALRGALDRHDLSRLRWVLYGGESYPSARLAALMRELPDARFSNVYGPAEVNQCTFHHLVDPPIGDLPVPIGRAWPAAEVRLVEPDVDPIDVERSVPRGRTGMLVVATGTMMLGYWERDDLTDRAVVEAPDHRRWYVTGDLAVEDDNGDLVFLGRADNQIKLRGHRIELEAVDAVLGEHPDVAAAVTVVDRPADADDRLVGLVVLRPEVDPTRAPSELITAARGRLPRYAVPAEIEIVAGLPRTTTGKVDRSAAAELLTR